MIVCFVYILFYTIFNFFFLCGSYLVVLKTYSWLFTQGLFLIGFWRTYSVQRIKFILALWKHPTCCTISLTLFNFIFNEILILSMYIKLKIFIAEWILKMLFNILSVGLNLQFYKYIYKVFLCRNGREYLIIE